MTVDERVHKHSSVHLAKQSEAYACAKLDNCHFLVSFRHPVLWLESVLHRANHNLASYYDIQYPVDADHISELAALYSRFYSEWYWELNSYGQFGIIGYESLLTDVDPLEPLFGIPDVSQTIARPDKLPNSLAFSEGDRVKNVTFTTELSPSVSAAIVGAVDPLVLKITGYTFDQLRLSLEHREESSRNFLYEFVRDVNVLRRTPPDLIKKSAQEYPASYAAHLALHLLERAVANESTGHIEQFSRLMDLQIEALEVSGADLGAVIPRLLEVGETAAAEKIAQRLYGNMGIMPLHAVPGAGSPSLFSR